MAAAVTVWMHLGGYVARVLVHRRLVRTAKRTLSDYLGSGSPGFARRLQAQKITNASLGV